MMSMTAAALTAILQNVIRSQMDAITAGRHRGRGSGD
jgi:hypothetical protein